jgi:hypothetical protein
MYRSFGAPLCMAAAVGIAASTIVNSAMAQESQAKPTELPAVTVETTVEPVPKKKAASRRLQS